MKRVAIDTTRFKISKPGYNVDTAAGGQLAFDGFANPYAGAILAGTTSTNDGSWSTTSTSPFVWVNGGWNFNFNQATRVYKSIPLPSTQTVPPDVIIMCMPIADQTYATPGYSHVNQYGSNADDWAGTAVWASTTNSTLELRVDFSTFGAGGIKDWKIAYLVFQNFNNLTQLYE